MNAEGVIDSYVHDVARRLPPSKRDDVAFELRTLLTDELHSRGEAEGRPADTEMAMELVRGFGRPAETAVRYYRPFTIIEPSDTWGFLVAAVGGGSLVSLFAGPGEEYATLAWFGLLVVGFGVKNLILRRRPDAFAWKPKPVRDTDKVNRVEGVGLALMWTALLVLYLAPGRVVEAVTFGAVDAERLAYSDSFTDPLRMPWLAGLLVALIALELLVVAQGRWRTGTRWARILLTVEIPLQLGWHARYGSIFEDADTERVLLPGIALTSGLIMIACGILVYRQVTRVRPAPATAT